MKQVDIEWEIIMPDDTPVLYDVTVSILSFGDPGRTWGDPEKCYPPEGPETEIDSIRLQPIDGYHGAFGVDMSPKLWKTLGFTDKILKEIQERALVKASEEARDDEADRADYEYERRRDDREIRESNQ